jgi:hypothetical protein
MHRRAQHPHLALLLKKAGRPHLPVGRGGPVGRRGLAMEWSDMDRSERDVPRMGDRRGAGSKPTSPPKAVATARRAFDSVSPYGTSPYGHVALLLTQSRPTAFRPTGTSRSLLTRSRPTASRPTGTSLRSCPNDLQAFGRFVQAAYKPSAALSKRPTILRPFSPYHDLPPASPHFFHCSPLPRLLVH